MTGPARSLFPVLLLALAVTAGCGAVAESRGERIPLQEQHLYQPYYADVPPREPVAQTLRTLATDIHGDNGTALLRRVVPSQSGTLWLSLCLLLLIALNYERPGHPRNIDLLLMQASGFLFFEIRRFFRFLHSPTYVALLDWVFLALVVVGSALLVRALWRVHRPAADRWMPIPPTRALAVTALLLLALNVYAALVRPTDDAGFFINLGAQRLIERGLLPYGDPLLTETPASAYGPVLYVAHGLFQLLVVPGGVNRFSPDLPPIGPDSSYFLPPILAAKLTVVAFHLLGVAALFVIAHRLRGARAAWALVALYCGSAYVLGVGSEGDLIGGMTFVSHVAPTATTLLAFACLSRPALSGGLLATSIGVLFYPVFMVPAWLGYYWDDRTARLRFLAGLTVTALLIGGVTLAISRPAGGRSLVGTVLHETLGHQENPELYGRSPFGFWGQREGLRAALMRPLVTDATTTRPIVLLYFAGVAATFFVTRRKGPAELALTVGAVVIGALIWKIHATATYVAWYYPFLLIGVLCGGRGQDEATAAPRAARQRELVSSGSPTAT